MAAPNTTTTTGPPTTSPSSHIEQIATPGIINKISLIYVIGNYQYRSTLCAALSHLSGFHHIDTPRDIPTPDLINNHIIPNFLRGEKIFLLEGFPDSVGRAEAMEQSLGKVRVVLCCVKGPPFPSPMILKFRREGLLVEVGLEMATGVEGIRRRVLEGTGDEA